MPRRLSILLAMFFVGPLSADEPDVWWSLRPVARVSPPIVSTDLAAGVRNPIDRFIRARLHAAGLRPSPEADRRTLIRRVTLDLTGLLPTPEEIDAFLTDRRPDAYERLVDRLLASPPFGERWARHWMDLVHYAETHGHDQDRPRPNAWPYRDYLIRSFNADKPYARIVQEQLAGDVLFPDDPGAIPALGFLATGPWDESSLRDIREDTLDRQIARYLDRDDMVTTALSSFLSTTVHCARCHDHKFDPITQKDYYALQAVFAGVDKAERTYDPDPQVAAARQRLRREQEALTRARGRGDAAFLTPALVAEVAAWERGLGAAVRSWVVLDPERFTSAGGATLSRLADRSILSGGKRPEKDTVTVIASVEAGSLTGLRLEVLTDPSLPHGGPGRQDNGNLHLNEIEVSVAPRGRPAEARRVLLRQAAADFDQDGWGVARSIDGNPATAWGIFPRVGQPHRAVFAFAEPVGFPGGTTLTIVLHQTHGGGHLIGRARLSVTTAAEPLSAARDALPERIADILAVPADRRTLREQVELAAFVREGQLARALAALPPPQKVYAAAADFVPDGSFKPAGKPRPVHVLRRGDVTRPGAEAAPGALDCIPGLEEHFRRAPLTEEGARRAALARWVTDPRHPLTWRSIVNRLWHHHFGRGLVDTPNDFGRMGSRPSHPELLDWLASYLQAQGGSLKEVHRLIVTSATYRQAVRHDARAAEVDADNRLLWRMNRTRLDAEQLRDALLLAAGKLDRTMGGPSVQQFHMTPGIHVTPNVDYLSFDVDRPENFRRAVYRFVFRTLPDPFLEALDCPDGTQLTPTRTASVTALQALALRNDKFVIRMSEHLAARAQREAPDLAGQLRVVYRRTLGREPTERETAALAEYARTFGLANACRVVINSNEFLFVN